MKKAPSPQQPRTKPITGNSARNGTGGSSSSRCGGDEEDPSLDMRSLEETLPVETSPSRRSAPPSKLPSTSSSSSRRSSLGPQATSLKLTPSRRASLGHQAPPKKPLVNPRVSLSTPSTSSNPIEKQLMKKTKKECGSPSSSRFRKLSTKKSEDLKEEDPQQASVAASLPMDSLCLCLEKLQSVYHVVTCASVCRHWREAVRSDVIWKALYIRWWFPEEANGVAPPPPQTVGVPPGFVTWRDAFKSEYSNGKRKIQSEVITHGVNAGWLHIRRTLDRHGKQVRDCMPGDGMRKLVEQLGLTFHVQVNRETPIRLRGRASVVYFPKSCLLRHPTKTTKGGLTLRSLKSFKITATSDRLLRTCTVASFAVQSSDGPWEMVSREGGLNPGPLRLLQQPCSPPSMSWIVGTLLEGVHGVDEFSMDEHGEEQVLLLMASLHWSDLVWTLLQLGEGGTPQVSRRVYHDHMNPSYGLYNWRASIQLHTFGKLLWGQEFHQVFWSPRESTPGQTAVFLLISSHEVFPGMLTSPWRTEVFSGELRGVFILDFTLWDPGMETAWHCTRAVRTSPAELATVEYGPPGLDGERVHTGVRDDKQGVSVSMNLCTPFAEGFAGGFAERWPGTSQHLHDDDKLVVITDLRFALTPKFLMSWFGRSNL